MGLNFASGSGLPVGLDMKTHGPDSLLYHVIYTTMTYITVALGALL